MAKQVEEIQRIRRNINTDSGEATTEKRKIDRTLDEDGIYEEEYYEMSDAADDEAALNTASGILAITLIALAVYLVWAVLR
jgi:hypothetical protein